MKITILGLLILVWPTSWGIAWRSRLHVDHLTMPLLKSFQACPMLEQKLTFGLAELFYMQWFVVHFLSMTTTCLSFFRKLRSADTSSPRTCLLLFKTWSIECYNQILWKGSLFKKFKSISGILKVFLNIYNLLRKINWTTKIHRSTPASFRSSLDTIQTLASPSMKFVKTSSTKGIRIIAVLTNWSNTTSLNVNALKISLKILSRPCITILWIMPLLDQVNTISAKGSKVSSVPSKSCSTKNFPRMIKLDWISTKCLIATTRKYSSVNQKG